MKKVYEIEYRTKIQICANDEEEAMDLVQERLDEDDYELELWNIDEIDEFEEDEYDYWT